MPHPWPTRQRFSSGSARRCGSRTSTTASAPSCTAEGGDARIFSRDLHDISDGYPEIVSTADGLDWDGVLDGELLAFRDGMALPFIQLQARLGRKNPSVELQQQVPVIYVAFDALALGPRAAASSRC